jgi:hypothetical protein
MPAKQGEKHHLARLTPELVIDLRSKYAAGGWSYMSLAEHLGYRVDESTVGRVIRGESWKHLPGAMK